MQFIFSPDDSEQEILSGKFLTVSHFREVLFQNILITPQSFISKPNPVDTL
jgi:hypothetical protein